MKLTNLQRETIVKDIYNEIVKTQNDYVKSEVDKQLAKRIAEYKKTPEYRTFLKLEEVNSIDGVEVYVKSESLFSGGSSYSKKIKSLEEIITYRLTEEINSTLKTPIRHEIEDKLILSSISGFDFEKFKKSILTEFVI